ncbi:MAG: class II aldolase/adducin family protein [Lachnospiraceae bacterium]|nr:class II aldolase/adducin family protein [Lachnospiraceae bacterium]
MNLRELISMSNRYGSNPDYVLAGGGNTSVKEGGTLYVKCSGTCLADIEENGFVAMSIEKLRGLMEKEYPAGDKEREAAFLADVMDARTDADLSKRPSVEALLHSLFPQKYVLHVHPALINGLTCSQGAGEKARELFGDTVLWIPTCRPGYMLGKLCFDAMAEYEKTQGRKVQILLLQNHGIFVAGDTVAEIDGLFAIVENTLAAAVQRKADLNAPDMEMMKELEKAASALSGELGMIVELNAVREASAFVESEETAGPLLVPFTPDHIVYSGAYPLFLTSTEGAAEKKKAFEEKNGFTPKVILLRGVGIFVMADSESAREKAKLLNRDAMKVAVYTESFGGALPMTEDLTEFILHWEAESYRSKQG